MTEAAVLQIISTTGAAAVLFWIVYQFITGKLHTNSELDARDRVITKQDGTIERLTTQLEQTNDILDKAMDRRSPARRGSVG